LGTATFEEILKLLNRADWDLGQSNDVNIAFSVFSEDELISLVEKVEEFGAVNFVEGKVGSQVTVLWLSYLNKIPIEASQKYHKLRVYTGRGCSCS
jgi:hypothetical protein